MSLNTVVSSLSSEDYLKFLSFLTRKNRRTDVKNIQLFKLLYADELSSDEIYKKLYPNSVKDAYHALRKRLYASLIDFLAKVNLEEDNTDQVQIIKYILVARSFLEQQQYSPALKLLSKAENIAKEYQLYAYLNEIYHAKIQYSHAYDNLDLQQVIFEFKENQKLYILEEELTIVYAKVRAVLHQIQYKGELVDFQELLNTILSEHNISIDDTLSFKSLYQLLTVASISAFVTKDYLNVEPFMMYTYNVLKGRNEKDKQRFYHIQVLYMISNTLFRTKQFKKSMHFLEMMKTEMLENKKKYYKRFLLKYELLHLLNLNYTNQSDKAISRAEGLLQRPYDDLEAVLDIHLSLIVFYCQQNTYTKAYSLLNKLYHTDKWYIEKVGKEWVVKKNLIELLILVELDDFDMFHNKLLRFKRLYSDYLKGIGQERVLTFLKLVELYYNDPKCINSEEFLNRVKTSFEWLDAKHEDIFVMSFYAWLKSKMLKQPIYEVTLNLVTKAK